MALKPWSHSARQSPGAFPGDVSRWILWFMPQSIPRSVPEGFPEVFLEAFLELIFRNIFYSSLPVPPFPVQRFDSLLTTVANNILFRAHKYVTCENKITGRVIWRKVIYFACINLEKFYCISFLKQMLMYK